MLSLSKNDLTIERVRRRLYNHPLHDFLEELSMNLLSRLLLEKNTRKLSVSNTGDTEDIRDEEIQHILTEYKSKNPWPVRRKAVQKFKKGALKTVRLYSSQSMEHCMV